MESRTNVTSENNRACAVRLRGILRMEMILGASCDIQNDLGFLFLASQLSKSCVAFGFSFEVVIGAKGAGLLLYWCSRSSCLGGS